MVRKVLIAALLSLSLWSSIPTVLAENTTNSQEHFDAFDILNVEEDQGLGGSTDLAGEIRDNAEGENGSGSVVAALILRAINLMMLTIGTFGFLTLFYAGILMVTANGDESKIDRAKSIFTQTLLGFIFAFLSYSIVVFVQSFFY
jgi:hypothetical protein